MSALAITEAVETTWAEVQGESSVTELHLVATPAADSRTAEGGWRLTERGIAVAVFGALAVFLTGLVVLVGAFLAVPNEPLNTAAPSSVVFSAQR